MIEGQQLTTNALSAPKVALTKKLFWKCIGYRPQSGLPKAADGSLVLTYIWEATRKDGLVPAAPKERKAHRGVMVDLFGQ